MEISQETKPYGITLIILALVTVIYFYCGKNRRIKKYVDKIPGPLSLPIIGSGFWFVRPTYEIPPLFLSWFKSYGSIFRFWNGNQANVVLAGVPEIEKILASNVHLEKSTDYSVLHKWLGNGLLTAAPARWHPRRKQLTPAFHFKILEEFVPIFNEQGNIFVELLREKESNTDRFFDIAPYVTNCTLDIICETAMGIQLNAQISETQLPYVRSVYGYTKILLLRFMRPWLKVDFIWNILGYGKSEKFHIKELQSFTENVIQNRKVERNNAKLTESPTEDKKKRKAFLDLLLDLCEGENSLTDVQLLEETATFMFEGHDTTAANLNWTIFLLALNPEYQKRIQAELDAILEGDLEREIISSDVAKMKTLECCVKEALRLFPSVAFFVRHLREDFDLGNNLLLPKGINCWVGPLLVHRDPTIYSNPEEFKPERFLSVNAAERSPFSYIPFSAGNRNCIGQKFALLEDKIVLAKLLLNFDFVAKAKSQDEVKMLPDIILRPYPGVEVKVFSRNK